jgi:hypothetical protein
MPAPYAVYLLKIRGKPTPPNRRDEEPLSPQVGAERA